MTTILWTCPAFDVVEGPKEPHTVERLVMLNDGDKLFDLDTKDTYAIGSVISYALRNGEDPIKNLERAKERGHALHFVYGLAVSISNMQQARKTYIGVKVGERIRFEGRVFEIGRTFNRNLKLTEVERAPVEA